jgi:outer membrane protein assembly factor BamB
MHSLGRAIAVALVCSSAAGVGWGGALRLDGAGRSGGALRLDGAGANWPQWRGPAADGISQDSNPPVEWDTTHNIAWKTKLPGLGTSTPIVWDDLVILTTQIGDSPVEGRSFDFPGSPTARRSASESRSGKVRFVVSAYSRRDGKPVWEYSFDAAGDLPPTHSMHNLASPSCVTDGNLVYAWVATGQLVALDMKGKLVWSRNIGREYSNFMVLWGHGSSPVLYKDLLILLCDHFDAGYLLALDKRSGKQVWKADRGAPRRSYSTPYVIPDGSESGGALRLDGAGGQIVVNSEERVDVYSAANGELLWWIGDRSQAVVPSPVWHDGILYTSRGYSSGPYFAVQPGGKGDARSRVKWEVHTGAPYVSSLLYYRGLLYMATENGVATAVDAEDGKTLWKQRLGGVFSASPVAADGKVYLLNEEGETIVLEAGREPKILSRNKLEERTLASPAISNGQIFIRSDESLFCIGKGSSPGR